MIQSTENKKTKKMDFEKVVEYALGKGVSDIHIAPDTPIFLRRHGNMESVGSPVTAKEIEVIAKRVMNASQANLFEKNRQIDFLYTSQNGHRLRGNAFFSDGGISMSFRVIESNIIDFATLGFPDFVRKMVVNAKQGLILVVGPTGQGKSTTLASILQERAKTNAEHLLMLEDPIEYVIPKGKSIIQQRDVGRDVLSFAAGLTGAMREDPDVLMVGELRDTESMGETLTMAETGHLVLSTLHTNNAVQTITRILNSFPADQRPQVQSQLASSLSLVISQRLVPRADGNGRVLAYEIFKMNYAIANYIRQDKIFQIPNVIQTDSSGKMIQFEQSLVGLVMAKQITKEVAIEYAQDKVQLKALFEFNNIG